MGEAGRLIVKHGGSLSGEHGDGRARSALLHTMYSPRMLQLFAQFKAIFDPGNLFNPGVLVEPDALTDGLRMTPQQRQLELTEIHRYPADQGGLLGGINRCVGVGASRSLDGAMCPSFQITRDEVHSTRGRARVLAELMRGETVDTSDAIDALDLCLSCKACADECPVSVDMATYKAEIYRHHYRRRLRPRAHLTLGWLPLAAHLAHKIPGLGSLIDAAFRTPAVSSMVRRLGGLLKRPLIRFAAAPLTRGVAKRGGRKRVVLWPDTFNNHLDTAPGRAVIEVLELLGYEVVMPEGFVCCGLTWHSTGQLKTARRVIEHTAKKMRPFLDEGLPVLGLEPSCTVMLAREMTALSPHEDVRRLSEATVSWATFVAPHLGSLKVPAAARQALTQVHCHEQALGDPSGARAILEALGIEGEEIGTGCCGLAGNWGFEKGHAEMSFELGERELFPRVRAAEGEVIANGFSCRTQIEQGTGRRARHLAEVVRDALRGV